MTFKLTVIGFIAAAATLVSAEAGNLFSLFKKSAPEALTNRGNIGYCNSKDFGTISSRYNSGDTFTCNDGTLTWTCTVFTGGYSCSGSSGLVLISNSPSFIDPAMSLANYGNVGYCNANTLPYVAGRYANGNTFNCGDGHYTWYCATSGKYYSCTQYEKGLNLADNTTDADP